MTENQGLCIQWLASLYSEAAKGKTIQFRSDDAKWVDCICNTDFPHMGNWHDAVLFRIKPEPRKFWVVRNGPNDIYVFETKKEATRAVAELGPGYIIIETTESV